MGNLNFYYHEITNYSETLKYKLFSFKGMAVDIGAIQRLPKIVGSGSLVRELLFTGRKLLAEEAKECGLVSKIFNSKEE